MRINLNKRGVSLITVLVITTVLALLGIALLKAVLNGFKISRRVTDTEYSFFSAESAVESFTAGSSFYADNYNAIMLENFAPHQISYEPDDIVSNFIGFLKTGGFEYGGLTLEDIIAYRGDDSIKVRFDSIGASGDIGISDVHIIYDSLRIIPIEMDGVMYDYINNGSDILVRIGGEAIATYKGPNGKTGRQKIYFEKDFILPYMPFQLQYAIQSVGDIIIDSMDVNISGGLNAYGTSPANTKYLDDQHTYGGIMVRNNSTSELTGDIITRSTLRVGADNIPEQASTADIVLLVDVSASMRYDGILDAKEAVKSFMISLAEKNINANIAIVPYCGSANNYFEMATVYRDTGDEMQSILQSDTYELQELLTSPELTNPWEKINPILRDQQEWFINAEKGGENNVGEGYIDGIDTGVHTIIAGLRKFTNVLDWLPPNTPQGRYYGRDESKEHPFLKEVVIEATNYGDALRRAYYILKGVEGNNNPKFVVFMSDGGARAYTSVPGSSNTYFEGEGNIVETQKIETTDNMPWVYAEQMAAKLQELDVMMDFIAYKEAADPDALNNNGSKLQESIKYVISASGNDPAKSFKIAEDSGLSEVFNSVAEGISNNVESNGFASASNIKDAFCSNLFASGISNNLVVNRNAYVLRHVVNEDFDNLMQIDKRLFGLSDVSYIKSDDAIESDGEAGAPIVHVEKDIYLHSATGNVNSITEASAGNLLGDSLANINANGGVYDPTKFNNSLTMESMKVNYVEGNELPEFLTENVKTSFSERIIDINNASEVRDIFYSGDDNLRHHIVDEMEEFVVRNEGALDTPITHSLNTGPGRTNLFKFLVEKSKDLQNYPQVIYLDENFADTYGATTVRIQDIEALGTPSDVAGYYYVVCNDARVDILIQGDDTGEEIVPHTFKGIILTTGRVVFKHRGYVDGAIIAAGRGYDGVNSSVADDNGLNMPIVDPDKVLAPEEKSDYLKMMNAEFAAVYFKGGKTETVISDQNIPPEIALVVDLSGSMNDNLAGESAAPSRIDIMHEALTNFVNDPTLKAMNAKVTIVPYQGSANNYYGRAQKALAGTYTMQTTVGYELYDINTQSAELQQQLDLMIRRDNPGDKGEIGERRYFMNYRDTYGPEIAKLIFDKDPSYDHTNPDDSHFFNGTNTGDGIRRGYWALVNNGQPGANKYLVTMTDGHSNKSSSPKVDDSCLTTTGSGDATDYARSMAAQAEASGIIAEQMFIAIADDYDSGDIEDLNNIGMDAGIPAGPDGNHFDHALTVEAIEEFYESISGIVTPVTITEAVDASTNVTFVGENQTKAQARDELLNNIGVNELFNIL